MVVDLLSAFLGAACRAGAYHYQHRLREAYEAGNLALVNYRLYLASMYCQGACWCSDYGW